MNTCANWVWIKFTCHKFVLVCKYGWVMAEWLERWLQQWAARGVSKILVSPVRYWHPPHEAIRSYLVFTLMPEHGVMLSCLLHTKLYQHKCKTIICLADMWFQKWRKWWYYDHFISTILIPKSGSIPLLLSTMNLKFNCENMLWPRLASEVIWCWKSWSTLDQIMA